VQVPIFVITRRRIAGIEAGGVFWVNRAAVAGATGNLRLLGRRGSAGRFFEQLGIDRRLNLTSVNSRTGVLAIQFVHAQLRQTMPSMVPVGVISGAFGGTCAGRGFVGFAQDAAAGGSTYQRSVTPGRDVDDAGFDRADFSVAPATNVNAGRRLRAR